MAMSAPLTCSSGAAETGGKIGIAWKFITNTQVAHSSTRMISVIRTPFIGNDHFHPRAIKQPLIRISSGSPRQPRHDDPCVRRNSSLDGHPRTAPADGQLDRECPLSGSDILQRSADITTAKLLEHRVGSALLLD